MTAVGLYANYFLSTLSHQENYDFRISVATSASDAASTTAIVDVPELDASLRLRISTAEAAELRQRHVTTAASPTLDSAEQEEGTSGERNSDVVISCVHAWGRAVLRRLLGEQLGTV